MRIPALEVDTRYIDSESPLRMFRQGMADRTQANQENLLKMVGQTAASGNLGEAANVAMRGGDVNLGLGLQDKLQARETASFNRRMKVEEMNLDKRLKAIHFLNEGVKRADTPEKYRALVGIASDAFGPEMVKGFESWEARPEAMTALEKAQLQLLQAQAAQAQQKAGQDPVDQYIMQQLGMGAPQAGVPSRPRMPVGVTQAPASVPGIVVDQPTAESAVAAPEAQETQSDNPLANLSETDRLRFLLEYKGKGGAADILAPGGGASTPYRMTPDQRADLALQNGLDPNSDEFRTFVMTGQLPRHRARQFTVNDLTKLSEEGTKARNINRFSSTFKDMYSGWGSRAIGDAAMTTARNLPIFTGPETEEAAGWWQDYDRYKNMVRNELFGSALTATEQAAFEKADINPGMDPKIVRQNLSRQKELIDNGLIRKARSIVKAGYDAEPVAEAYGIDPSVLDVSKAAPNDLGGGRGFNQALEDARDAIGRGADREKVIERLRENGIDPSGL